jgi:hypothetical protein
MRRGARTAKLFRAQYPDIDTVKFYGNPGEREHTVPVRLVLDLFDPSSSYLDAVSLDE